MPTRTQAKQNPTVSTTAQDLSDMGFTAAQIAGARRLFITCSGGAIRYFLDGTTPTATYGEVCSNEITYEFTEDVAGFKCIRQDGDVVLTVELDTYV